MAKIVKNIKGHEYIYDVTWDSQKKKQIWKYLGKAKNDFDPEKLKDDIYKAIKKDFRINISKKNMKYIRNAIAKVIESYKEYW
ncbi:MAG: hypothetical protein J7J36_04550 [Thermoplasmata archaeon]|nr:hypothetical protein [Thermoplasmata archaeon]